MKHICWVVFSVLATLARTTHAQTPSAGEAPADDEPSIAPEPPADSEPVLPPEHVGGGKPTTLPGEPSSTDQELTLDRLVLSAANRIDLNFFGDVSLIQLNEQKAAFTIGAVGFQVTAHLADHLVGRTEYVVKYAEGETVIDLERLYLEYRTARWALIAGRTHSELGYWNTAFHHGTWLQLTMNRPHVLDFEEGGGILETHSVGLTAMYGPKRGDSGVDLMLAVGNGHGRTIDVVQTGSDNNWAKSVLLRLGLVGIGHPALRFGINVGVDEIAAESAAVRPLLPDKSILELVTGFYLALRSEGLVVYSETYNILHHGGGQTWQLTDGFLLAGYRFGAVTPFGEIEARRGDGFSDPYYRPDPAVGSHSIPPANFVEGTLGVRYELNAWSALKVEVAAASFSDRTDYRAEINWSFGR